MSRPDASLAIGPGTRVTLHFTILLPSGEEVDSTWNRRPATFEVGDGNLLPGFERALFGLVAGDTRRLDIAPEDGFGMPNPDNIQTLERDSFPADLALEEGLMVSFADAARAELPGVVRRLDADRVEVDFNHPLAGRSLIFDVNIIRVEAVA
ncbi:MAG: peptidylprolyl isomerase [Gammaproteobacteria bacterium]|nr:peptidylprolyl isomerase [Gammaproteobacteria bacterium]